MKLPPQVAQDLINVYLNMKKAKTIGGRLELIGHPVTDAEFEVIEPKTEQHGNDESAGDGNPDHGGKEWSCIAIDGTGRPTDIYYT